MKPEHVASVIYDLCVIGSGPAGIIVALEYTRLNPGRKALLIEYGSPKQGSENGLDNSIQIPNRVNHHPPYECTNKGLGGTSATWGGRCVMYDDVDFIDRPAVAGGCTWDLNLFREVTRYVPRTADYFECGNPVFNLNDLPQLRSQRITERFEEGVVTDSVLERWSMPTRFGKRYAKEIAECPNLTVLEGYEARTFSPPDNDGKVTSLAIRSIDTQEVQSIRAEAFVLAAGAQESTRILLRNAQLFGRLACVPVALGKYYQGHLSGKIASVRFRGKPEQTDYSFRRDEDGIYIRRRFQFSTQFLVEQNLLNSAIWLDNPLYHDPRHRSGAMSFMYLAMLTPFLGKKLAPPAIAQSITKGKVNGISKHLRNTFRRQPL